MCEHCGCSSDSNHSHLIIPIKGMKSENCESRIETALNNLQGVLHAHADSHKGEVSIALDKGGDLCDVKNTLNSLGFSDLY